MVRNFEINESDQHALSYIESSEVFLSSVCILFSQKCWIFQLEDKMQRIYRGYSSFWSEYEFYFIE